MMAKKCIARPSRLQLQIVPIIALLICSHVSGQSNFWGQAKYSIPSADFIAQFSDTAGLSRIYCFNKRKEKVWLTNIRNYLLTLELTGSDPKKLELVSARYENGKIEGTELKRSALKNRPVTFNFSDVSSITLQSSYSVESPYFDFDSCKKIWKWKTDSIAKYVSGGKEVVVYLIHKNNPNADSLLICENACFDIQFKDNVHTEHGVVQKITNDSIYISNHFDVTHEGYKVLAYLLTDMTELRLLKGGGYSYKKIIVSDYNIIPFEMEKDALAPSCWFKINSYSGKVELYRTLLTTSGFLGIKEENGKFYWYE